MPGYTIMASKKAVEKILATLTTTYRVSDDPQVGEDWKTMLDRLTDAEVAIGRETMILKHQSNFAPAPAAFLEWAKAGHWQQLGSPKEKWKGKREVGMTEFHRRMGQLRDVMAGKIKLPKNGTPEENRRILGWPPHRQRREA